MLLPRKRRAIIEWFNCVVVLDSPLESIQQLCNGHHFKKLINMIDPSTEEVLPDGTDIYKFLEEFLNGYFHSPVGAFISAAACSQGDEFELAKVSILLLSAVVQHSLSKGSDFLSNLTQLDEGIQEDIKDCMQAVILPTGDKLAAEFSDVLRKCFMYPETPVRQIPRRRSRRNVQDPASSPLKCFLDSPMFMRQTAVRNLESKVALLQQELEASENRATEFEVAHDSMKQMVQNYEQQVKELKGKIEEFNVRRDSAEEFTWTSIEKYETEIASLRGQKKEKENELSRLQKENVELLNNNHRLQSKVEECEVLKSRSLRLASDLQQCQSITANQKALMDEIKLENMRYKKELEDRVNEVKKVHSLYEDAMTELRKLQNSPDLPKGESMNVITEMQILEHQKEIKLLKETEVELKDHLKASTVHNEKLKTDIVMRDAELCKAEERYSHIIQNNEKELSELRSNISLITNEKRSLQEELEKLLQEKEQQKIVYEQKLSDLTSEIDCLKAQTSKQCIEYEKNLVKLREELSDAGSKLTLYSENEQQHMATINDLLSQKAALSRKLEQNSAELEEASVSKTALECKEKEVSILNLNIASLKQKNSSTERELQDLRHETESWKHAEEQKVKGLTAKLEDAKNQYNQTVVEHEGKIQRLQDEISDAESKLKFCYEKQQHDQNSLNRVTSEKNALFDELEQTKAELCKTNERLNNTLECNERGAQELSSLKEESCYLQQKINSLCDENANLKQQIVNHENDSKKFEAQLCAISSKFTDHENVECDTSSREQVILEINALSEELKLCKAKHDEIELKFSSHLDGCKNNKDADNLRGALDELATENVRLQKQLNEDENKQKEMEENIGKLCKEIQDTQNICNKKDEERNEEIRKSEDLLQKLKEENQSAESKHLLEVKNLNHCIEVKDMCIKKTNEELQKCKEIVQNRNVELRNAQTSNSKLVEEMSLCKQEKSKLEDQLCRESGKIKKLQNSVEELKKEKDSFRRCLRNLESENHSLTNNLKKMAENIKVLEEEKRVQVKDIGILSKKLQEVEETHKRDDISHKTEIKRIQDLLHKSQEEAQALVLTQSTEMQDLTHSVEEKEKDLEKACKAKEKLEEVLNKRDSEFGILENRLAEVEASKSKLLSDMSNGNTMIKNLESSLEKLNKEKNNLSSENSEITERVKDMKKSLTEMAEQLKNKDKNILELSKVIQQLQDAQNQQKLEKKDLEDLLKQSEQQNKELESKHLIEINKLNQCIEDKAKHTEMLSGNVEQLKLQKRDEIGAFEEALEESHTINSSLRTEMQAECNRLTLFCQELENLLENAKSEKEALKKEIAVKEEKMNEIESMLKTLTENREREISELSDLTKLREQNQSLQLQVKQLEAELCETSAQMQNIVDSRSHQNSETDFKIDTLTNQLNEYQTLCENTKLNHLEHLKTCSVKDDTIKGLKISLRKLSCEKDDMQKLIESLEVAKQELMEKLQDIERRHDNLSKQKEISESDFSRCVEKRDADIEKLNKQIQELEFKSKQDESHGIKLEEVQCSQEESKPSGSKYLMEVHNLKQCLEQKEKLLEKNYKKIQRLEDLIKVQKDEGFTKIKNSIKEAEAARYKLLTEVSCLTEEKLIDKEKIDKLTSENKRLSSYNQQQKKIIEDMKQIQKRLIQSETSNQDVQKKYLEQKKRTDLRMESLKKSINKLESEKADMEKRMLSLKQKLLGYQNYKRALAEEQNQLQLVKKELKDSQKRVNQLEQVVQNYKHQKFCLESELRRIRSELNEMKSNYYLDDLQPVTRRFSSSLTPVRTPSQKLGPSKGCGDEDMSPVVWKKPAARRRMSNASSLASCFSTSSETVCGLLEVTPNKAGYEVEEDFLDYSRVPELKPGPSSAIRSSTKRLSELQRRNSLCPPHMRSSYPVETQMRPVFELSDSILKNGHAVESSSKKTVLSEKHQNTDKVVSPKRKRSSSDESQNGKVTKVTKRYDVWGSIKSRVSTTTSPGPSRTPIDLKNLFVRKRAEDVSKRVKGKRF